MVYRGEYDPYGNLVYEWGSAGLNTRKFTGYERDATGLDYANARMYDPGRGRFMQPDPAGLKGAKMKIPGSLNRYSYVNNDPVNMVDVTKTTGIYFYLNPCIFMICDSMTVSAGLGSTIGHNPNMFPGEFLPEEGGVDQGALGNPFQGAYEACQDKTMNVLDAYDLKTNFTADVAQKILHVTGMVGKISEALLAVTWAMESRFEWNPITQYMEDTDTYDVGPMQLNSYFTANDIGDGFYDPTRYGFRWEDIMGTYSKGTRFNGSHHANILVGALKLKWLLDRQGSEREAARAYVGSTGNPGPEARKTQYDLYSNGFKTFFDCYKNNLGL